MRCKRCQGEMTDLDGLNFFCSRCNFVFYRDDPIRENYLEKRGAKHCFNCGHVAVQPGLLPNNGNGHVCLNCRSEYFFRKDYIEIFPISSKLQPFKDKKIRVPIILRNEPERRHRASFFSAIFLVVAMIYLAGCAVIVSAEYTVVDVNLTSDPKFGDINDPVNLANATPEDTVIGEWQRDLGDDMPNGTYYGTLLRPGIFEFTHLTPTWRQNATPSGQDGQYTYAMFSGHFNLSAQKIMAGASEWWMRTPLHPDSIEGYFGLSMSIFKGVDNASDVRIYGNYSCGTDRQNIRPRADHNGYTPDVIVEYDSTAGSSGGAFSDYKAPLDMRIANDHVYIQANAVLEPSVDYVISLLFRLPKEGHLKAYFNTAERPAGGWTAIDTAEIRIHGGDGGPTYYVEKLDSYLIEFPIDLDWSFIFTEGVGMGGLFGKKITIPENHTLTLYPYFNTSRVGSQYMSFMLPWISDDTVNITPQVYSADGQFSWNFTGGLSYFNPELEYMIPLAEDAASGDDFVVLTTTEHLWIGKPVWIDDDNSTKVLNFIESIDGDTVTLLYDLINYYELSENAHMWMMIPMGWNYSDYCLFSTNDTLDWATFSTDDSWNIELELLFHDPITMTLLCYYEGDREVYQWSDVNFSNSSRNPYQYPYTWGWPGNSETSETYKLHYKVYISARGTDGQWAILNTTASGRETYTHYFPQRIHLSSATWFIQNGTTKERYDFDSRSAYYWYKAGEEWKQGPGHYLKAISYGIQSIAYGIWDGGANIVGTIHDFLSDAWEGFKRIGEWVVTAVASFIGKVFDFFTSAYNTIVSWWQSAQYLVAPLLMMAIIGVGGKLTSGMMKGRGDT